MSYTTIVKTFVQRAAGAEECIEKHFQSQQTACGVQFYPTKSLIQHDIVFIAVLLCNQDLHKVQFDFAAQW